MARRLAAAGAFSVMAVALSGVCLGDDTVAAAPAPITLHYNERPPYLVTYNWQLTGLTGGVAVAAFKKAGVDFVTHITPSARQLVTLQENRGLDCAVGWFRNAEREAYARYTQAIYRDQPQIALTNTRATAIRENMPVEDLLRNKKLILLTKRGYSYGPALDALIARLQPVRQEVTGENTMMLQSILAGRADYMFTAPEEADGLIRAAGVSPSLVRRVGLSGAPPGESRHILCSMSVPPSVIERLDAAIAEGKR